MIGVDGNVEVVMVKDWRMILRDETKELPTKDMFSIKLVWVDTLSGEVDLELG